MSAVVATATVMRSVRLYGALGRKFGRHHRLAVKNPAEAVRALSVNYPAFRAHLREHSEPGYQVLTDQGAVDRGALHEPCSDICIVPVLAGAKKGGLFSVILGGALLAFSFGAFAPGLASTAIFGTTVGSLAGNIGLSLVLGGVSQLLAPTPPTPTTVDRPENRPSFAFDGAVNTAAQGNAVPVGYGRGIVGSVVISSGLQSEELVSG